MSVHKEKQGPPVWLASFFAHIKNQSLLTIDTGPFKAYFLLGNKKGIRMIAI